jgi:hypothetical protein
MRLLFHCSLILVLIAGLAACDSQAKVEFVIPSNGQAGLSSRTIIAVRLSSGLSTGDLEKNVDPANIVVTGDQTEGTYTGTITPASFGDVFNGQTIEQFRQGIISPDGTTRPAAEEGAVQSFDTLVFILADNVSFKPGERISVFVDPKLRVRGSTMDSATRFSFIVAGGTATADGDFFVASIQPTQETSTIALRPDFRATFSLAVRTETLADGIVVRGEQSGFHSGGSTLFPSGASVTEVTRRLASTDVFVPGELVTVTWSSAIRASGTTSLSLSPYTASFRVQPGELTGLEGGAAGWDDVVVATGARAPRAVVTADFLPETDGIEIAVIHDDHILLYAANGTGGFSESESPMSATGIVKGAVTEDTNDDGDVEVVLVVEGTAGSEIRVFEIGEDETFVGRGDPVAFPARPIDGVARADLDGDGLVELVVLHADTSFPASEAANAATLQSGSITFFTLVAAPPLGGIDLNDPESLLHRVYSRIDRPIVNFERARRITAADLDGDGRTDLVAETATGLALYRNQHTATARFAFRRVGLLGDASGSGFVPDAWVLADVDRDRDVDILTWGSAGALFHENRQPAASADRSDETTLGLLFEVIAPKPFPSPIRPGSADQIVAGQIDGDSGGAVDLIIVRGTGGVDVLVGSKDSVFGFEAARSFVGGSTGSGIALADLDDDTGVDIVTASSDGVFALASDSRLIVPVTVPEPSGYSFELEDETADTFLVHVIGDITVRFSGYSIALDYDETLLSYRGFEIPESFQRTATFELCPNAQLLGCSGTAAARMTYQSGTVGIPTSGVELGAFRFRRSPVTEETQTKIEFKSFTTGNQSFANAIVVAVGDVSESVDVGELGDPVEIDLEPPPTEPGPELAIQCSVLSRAAKSYQGRVTWQSPRGTVFENVLVEVGGKPLPQNPIPWEQGGVEFQDDSTGAVAIAVTALLPGVDPAEPGTAPTQSCGIVSIFEPTVVCEPRTGANIVRWTLEEHAVESFNVYRNGVRIGVVSGGSDFVFEDRFPSPEGADNYEVGGVIAAQEGPRGSCRGQDPTPCVTQDPVALSSALDRRTEPRSPNVIRFRWRNGEAYDRILARLSFSPAGGGAATDVFGAGREISGNATELVFDGDLDRGGASPGTYALRIQGFAASPQCAGDPNGASAEISFPTVAVPVPPLSEAALACTIEPGRGIRATWKSLWRGYDDFLTLIVVQEVDGVTEEFEIGGVLLGETARLIESLDGKPLEPFGAYRIRLAVSHAGETLTTECGPVSFSPRIELSDVDAGVGIEGLEIPIRASGIFDTIESFEFTLEFPTFLSLDGVVSEPSGPGRRRVTLRASGLELRPASTGASGGSVVLARLIAAVPADANLGGRSEPITLSETSLRFRGSALARDVAAASATIRVRQRFVVIDQAEVDAGNTDPVRIGIRATFAAPPSAPDYKFNAFQIHLKFDHRVLELLPFRLDAQAGTVIDDKGFLVFPDAPTLAAANQSGFVKYAWLGFDLTNPSAPAFLTPVTNGELIVIEFRSRLPAGVAETQTSISFVTDATAEQPTAFFPVEDVPGIPDMEAFISGGIAIRSDARPPAITRLDPARGGLTGGNRVRLLGSNLPTAAADLIALELVSLAGARTAVDPANIEFVDDEELVFIAPDSGLRSNSFLGKRLFDVRLETSEGSATLTRGYSYEAPILSGTDVTSVHAGSGDFIVIRGEGLAAGAGVELAVAGFVDVFPLDVFRIESDGTSIVAVASGLPSPGAGEEHLVADLRVILPESAPLVLPSHVRILPPSSTPEFALVGVDPSRASHCGGRVVTILGQGFTRSTTVEIGASIGVPVEFISSRELRFSVPPTSDLGTFALRIREGAFVEETPFVLDPPADFLRGDVDGNSLVQLEDATLLSRIVLGTQPTTTGQLNRNAFDVNDDGKIDFGDSIHLLQFLFEGGPAPSFPFPSVGQDPDNLADGLCE